MNHLGKSIILFFIALGCYSDVQATSYVRPEKVFDCDQSDETTFVLRRPYETILVKVGQNPSTGHLWYDSANLARTFKPDCQTSVPGCGGTLTYELTDEAVVRQRSRFTGSSTFRFELKRPGDLKTVRSCKIVIKK